MSDFSRAVDSAMTSLCGCDRTAGPVLVALSGGADSVALLLSLKEAGWDVVAAHCNFHLRGEDSDADERFVQDLCRSNGVQLHLHHPDVLGYMHSHGASLEMACRDLRYAWFEEMRKSLDAQAVAVGHHREDNIETLMLNLLRGTGLSGLGGMRWRRENDVIRPMLRMSKKEILEYLASVGQSWRLDKSNNENDVKRNRIRNLVMPKIYEVFPDAPIRITDTIHRSSEGLTLYKALLDEKMQSYRDESGAVNVSALLADYGHLAGMMLFEALRDKGLSREMTEDIMANPNRDSALFGAFHLRDGILYPIEDTEDIAPSDYDIESGPWELKTIIPAEFHPARNHFHAFFDADTIPAGKWTVRGWRKGDRIRPFGMKGSRLVSDIFTDRKVPLPFRKSIPIVEVGGKVVWIPGVINSSEFPITPHTSRIFQFIWRDSDDLECV